MNSFLCGRYFLYVLATYAVLIVISLILVQIGWQLPAGVGTVISSMVPALWVGNTYYKSTQSVPESGHAWKLSFFFTMIHLIFAMLIVALVIATLPIFERMMKGSGLVLLMGAVLFLAVIMFLTTRFFFMMGAKQAKKVASA